MDNTNIQNSLFESAYTNICGLVDNFKAKESYFLSPAYQEAEVRKDFIDKFFVALGWDVLHNEQHNPYEQEVKVERGVRVSGAQKRADYSFCLAPNYRDPKFYVEAKKPSKDLYNADYYFQTIRYGWHKATPLAILTDFEEFHILDCRFSPDINTILNRKIKYYHYTEYADRDKFADIYWLFSREAVANNSIIKRAETLPKPKGKAGKKQLSSEQVESLTSVVNLSIDDAFLVEIDGIRERLAKAFKKNDDNLKSEELTEATQRTINRLVFIRFLEDKLIEQEHYVSEFGKKGSAWNDFIALCKRLNVKYNGIVFKPIFIDEDSFKGAADNEFLKICQGLCHLNSRFLFNEIPIHILGSIYERFLGKVVNASDKRVKIEEKPEVRKAGGVYYTPKYIVDYIVQNTVGKLIDGKTSEQIAKLKFADIACGSGSFLISVYECLLDYHNKYYQKYKDKARKDGCLEKDGIMVLSIKQKQKILLNNVYGVDIDNQAVEVTQLSLYLKLLEDETTATANEMQVLFHEKILPDMSKNIICGNSLIGTDILTNNLFSEAEERKLNPMDFETAFPEVFKSKDEKGYLFVPDIGMYEEQDTDSNQANEPMYPFKRRTSGGFNAIVGNPPYVMLQNLDSKHIFNYCLNKFKSAKYKIDTYQLFIETSINILKNKGLLGYITPNTFLKNIHSEPLRKYILNETLINEILIVSFNVFKTASVDVCTFILEKNKDIDINEIIIKEAKTEFVPNERAIIKQANFKANNRYDFNITASEQDSIITKTIINNSLPLNLFCNAYFGIQTFNRKIFVSTEKINDNYKPVIDGANIEAYFLKVSKEFVNFIPEAIKSGGNEKVYTQDRICIRQIGNFPIATLVPANTFTLNTIYNVYKKVDCNISLNFLLGIINSNALHFYWKKMNSDEKQLFPKIKKEAILATPIPKINLQNKIEKEQHDKLVQFVELMLQTKKQLQTAKTDNDKNYFKRRCIDIDIKIDKLVYELYGLEGTEIDLITKSKKK